METHPPAALAQEIIRLTIQWAADGATDARAMNALVDQALLSNHRHYHDRIPHYRTVCERAGVGPECSDLARIAEACLLPDDLFKSYPQRLLDEGDFAGMNRWLSRICAAPVPEAACAAGNLDEWIETLSRNGLTLVFSSGTSGNVSFVPRDASTWHSFVRMPFVYLPFLLADRGVLPLWKAMAMRVLGKRVSPDRFLSLVMGMGLKDTDGIFLNFSGGNQGIQLVGQEMGKYVKSAHFLYPRTMSATAVRSIVRGAKTTSEQALADEFLSTTVLRKEENYARIISALRRTVQNRRKAIVFGTPYLLLELCRKVKKACGAIPLKKGSGVIFGGGWKSFDGSRIPEDELIALIRETFGVPPEAVSEGYSMTEIQALMVKCVHGRYHVPPYLRTLILDPELRPVPEAGATGIFAVMDPFAGSYPGFLITGDSVIRSAEPCPCGRSGETILRVERSPGREVKGCGGIMAKVNA
ncbi:MAG: hypothetical protein AB1921_03740 [Thermodesulfobacteriota bacterium]